MTEHDNSESRLSRWSKRKIAVARAESLEDEGAEIGVQTSEQLQLEEERQAELQANRVAAEAVNIEELNKDSDFSVFMKDGVPELLKKQAMASLWRTNPIFANVDGLVDYDDDFGSPDLIMKTFKSAYQAGRGYLDLFKEDEDVINEEVIETNLVDENDDEIEKSTEEELPDDSPEDPVTAEFETTESETAELEYSSEIKDDQAEFISVEDAPTPYVSLRSRLELDRA